MREIKSAMPFRTKNKPVKLKRVCAVSMGGFLLKVAWKIDDSDCFKWTFLLMKNNNFMSLLELLWVRVTGACLENEAE